MYIIDYVCLGAVVTKLMVVGLNIVGVDYKPLISLCVFRMMNWMELKLMTLIN